MRRAAVLGHPISHSLSPRLHGYWLREYGIEGSYEAIDTPTEKLAETLRRLAQEGYAGVNLTVPLKEAALPLLGQVDAVTERIGAVNTVLFKDSGFGIRDSAGHNTDAYGFITNLRQGGCDPQGTVAVVLGAGGAARAVVAGLMEAGAAEIVICNRNEARAQELAAALLPLPPSLVTSHPWHARHALLARTTLLINTTSLGMKGQPPLALNLEALPTDAFVTDIVYNPLETPLLEAACQRGNPTIDGLGMLLYQGQKAFEYFYGVLPEVTDALRREILS